jgi:hypothetical protein
MIQTVTYPTEIFKHIHRNFQIINFTKLNIAVLKLTPHVKQIVNLLNYLLACFSISVVRTAGLMNSVTMLCSSVGR